jgi:hypothetical protein
MIQALKLCAEALTNRYHRTGLNTEEHEALRAARAAIREATGEVWDNSRGRWTLP